MQALFMQALFMQAPVYALSIALSSNARKVVRGRPTTRAAALMLPPFSATSALACAGDTGSRLIQRSSLGSATSMSCAVMVPCEHRIEARDNTDLSRSEERRVGKEGGSRQ